MSNSESEEVEARCFNCGNTITMSVLKRESMSEMGQDILCRECDDTVDMEDDEDVEFTSFF